MNEVTLETHPLPTAQTSSSSSSSNNHHELTASQQSRDSDRTASVSGSTSTDSDRTPVRVDSQDSQVSDTETITDGHRWPRQNSVSYTVCLTVTENINCAYCCVCVCIVCLTVVFVCFDSGTKQSLLASYV